MAVGTTQLQVAIVGGGPAGLATALSLVRDAPELADRVVVLEQAHYPREKFCAGALSSRADLVLAKLGIEVDVPSVPVHGISIQTHAGRCVQRAPSAIGRVIRRVEFDHALVTAARNRGVRVWEGVRVCNARQAEGGWELHTSDSVLHARVLVGADGVGSVVRRSMGLQPSRLYAQVAEVDTELTRTDLDRDLLRFETLPRSVAGYCWDFPTLRQGRSLMCRGAYVLRVHGGQPSPAAQLDALLERRGMDPSRYRKKRFAERGYQRASLFARPGVLLAGEAAGVDPITGEGIPQALEFGEQAGRYLARCFECQDLRFEEWNAVVRRSRFGLDLALREAIAGRFFGPDRAWLEQFVVQCPWFLRCGLEYFAGRHVPRAWLARWALFGLITRVRFAFNGSRR
jgi:menaquinone-9 beta-reductase